MKIFYVYMMTNKINTVSYTGVTNSIIRRNFEYKNKGSSQQADEVLLQETSVISEQSSEVLNLY